MRDSIDQLTLMGLIDNTEDVKMLQMALHTATNIIWNYDVDIRMAEPGGDNEFIGVNLVEVGFCQGSCYKNKYNMIAADLTPKSKKDQKILDLIDKNL